MILYRIFILFAILYGIHMMDTKVRIGRIPAFNETRIVIALCLDLWCMGLYIHYILSFFTFSCF